MASDARVILFPVHDNPVRARARHATPESVGRVHF
jgi:hypothetical protein